MIKKIILALAFLLITNTSVFADEIVDSKGVIIPCKIETVMGGLVEYKKNGNLYMFTREEDSPVFNDYVDVQEHLFKKESVTRYYGKIVVKDMWGISLRNENGLIQIPFFKVKFVGIFKP